MFNILKINILHFQFNINSDKKHLEKKKKKKEKINNV